MHRCYALLPAAGYGARMNSAVPKQYLPLIGKPLIYHTIKRFYDAPKIERVYVVLSPDDPQWDTYDWAQFEDRLSVLRCGGDTRAGSVLNGLDALQSTLTADDWVLVHDAARPCLSQAHLVRLIEEVCNDPVGGLLAVPVADTLKRADAEGRVGHTEPREGLWQAQTPQMFRYGLLTKALRTMGAVVPTDESSAMENLGLHPRLVESDNQNLKVTYPGDLELAELILRHWGKLDA
jgi:2-C-methyl-D-erythritol 4-phosphate cytidylyltransferase